MLATAEQRPKLRTLGFAQLDPITYVHLASPSREAQMNRSCSDVREKLHREAGAILGLHRRLYPPPRPSPAETDMQRHFQLPPPSVHQMVLTLERLGRNRRQPGH